KRRFRPTRTRLRSSRPNMRRTQRSFSPSLFSDSFRLRTKPAQDTYESPASGFSVGQADSHRVETEVQAPLRGAGAGVHDRKGGRGRHLATGMAGLQMVSDPAPSGSRPRAMVA